MPSRSTTAILRNLRDPRVKRVPSWRETIAPDQRPPLELREIERKFLITEAPQTLFACPRALLNQGYLGREPGLGHVRVREVHDERFSAPEYYLTVKHRDGIARKEVNVPLSRESFKVLWALTAGRRLCKHRYYLAYRRLTIEVDIYEGANAGLVVAEVEFRDEAHASRFVPPAWFGAEVTRNPTYRNVTLATG